MSKHFNRVFQCKSSQGRANDKRPPLFAVIPIANPELNAPLNYVAIMALNIYFIFYRVFTLESSVLKCF